MNLAMLTASPAASELAQMFFSLRLKSLQTFSAFGRLEILKQNLLFHQAPKNLSIPKFKLPSQHDYLS